MHRLSRSFPGRARKLVFAIPLLVVLLIGASPPAPTAPPEPYLVKDIESGSGGSYPDLLGVAGGILFFDAEDACNLWKSDGSESGTVFLHDVCPLSLNRHLPNGGYAYGGYDRATVGSTIFFAGSDPDHGRELWKSDGTQTGTGLVKDISQGSASTDFGESAALVGTLIFTADDGVHGRELWKSDGTEAGTVLIEDIKPGPDGLAGSYLVSAGDLVYFAADDGVHGRELWRTDGSQAGTKMVKDIVPGSGGSRTERGAVMDGELFFSAWDEAHGYGLWKTDGTEAGTVLVKWGDAGDSPFVPAYKTKVKSTLFFAALFGCQGDDMLWVSDGTPNGTVQVKCLPYYEDPIGGFISEVGSFTAVDDMLFFAGPAVSWPPTSRDGELQRLWRSDGTAAGTYVLRPDPEIWCHPWTQDEWALCGLLAAGGRLYLSALTSQHGFELWRSDGTSAGTSLVKDLNPGPASSLNEMGWPELVYTGGTLFFPADDGTHGFELWAYDTGTCSPPPLPALLSPPDRSSTYKEQPVFEWSAVLGAEVYRIRVVEAESGTVMFNQKTSQTHHTPAQPLPPATYYWRIRAFSDCGESEWSAKRSLTILPAGLPAPELSLPPDGSTTCETMPSFAWSPVEGAALYRIQVDEDSDFLSPAIDRDTANPTYRPDSPLGPGPYFWRVRAASDAGGSDWSSTWTFIRAQCLYLPLVLRGR